MIDKFIKQFTDKKIEYVKVDNRYYEADQGLLTISKHEKKSPRSIGICLGTGGKSFKPSLPLLDRLSHLSNKKVFVNDKAAWLFMCGRDILIKSIIQGNVKSGLVLIQNQLDENIGYGIFENNIVRNLLDKGDYLRREANKWD